MSKIPWTERTCNPIVGCSKVSAGCKNCYAERMAVRLAAMGMKDYEWVTLSKGGWSGNTTFVESALQKPLNRKKPTMYFVCSMGDLFHESVPFGWIDLVMAVIALCPQHTFQVLTKRPERMAEYCEEAELDTRIHRITGLVYGKEWVYDYVLGGPRLPLSNLWLGVSVEDQKTADERIPHLLQIPAAVRFVSVEPMLDRIDIRRFLPEPNPGPDPYESQPEFLCRLTYQDSRKLNWVIVGAESGPSRRHCKTEWVESVVDQCSSAGVPVFVKQISVADKLLRRDPKTGEYPGAWPEQLRRQEMPCGEPSPSCIAGYWRRCECGQWFATINRVGPVSCDECMDKETT